MPATDSSGGLLTELLALLRAGDVAFDVQSALRDRLYTALVARRPELAKPGVGYDEIFADAYSGMPPGERILHVLIRAYTVHTIKAINDDLIGWLRADTYFRALSPARRRLGSIALFLAQLEAHLLLWHAKYEAWIPAHEEHCLVYLADEQQHGLGFPPNGSTLVSRALGHPPLITRRPTNA